MKLARAIRFEGEGAAGTLLAATCAWGLLLSYTIYFSLLSCALHSTFGTSAYDLGTFDQGVWLAGHGRQQFLTVRGLHLLGDHVRLISFVLAPIYYVWDDVRGLLVLQTIAIAGGGWFLWSLARDVFRDRLVAPLAILGSYLLNPAVQNLNLEQAHPDAFASAFLLAALWSLRRRRFLFFWIASCLAMSCKEDVSPLFLVLGLTLLASPDSRRMGFGLATVAALYFCVSLFVVLPYFNGYGFFRFDHGGFFTGLGENWSDWSWLAGKLLRGENVRYLLELGSSTIFLFLFAPATLALAGPTLLANMLSDATYPRSLVHHYQALAVPVLYVATIDGIARLASQNWRMISRRTTTICALAVLAASIATNLAWSRAPLDRPGLLPQLVAHGLSDPKVAASNSILSMIPTDCAVSAGHRFVPHLSHRRSIYMFPNPYRPFEWGIRNENPHDASVVDYVMVSRDIRDHSLVEDMLSRDELEFVAAENGVELYGAVAMERPHFSATCGDWTGNGKRTELDVRLIARAIAAAGLCPLRICDIDGDGSATLYDAAKLKEHIDGASGTLNCSPAR